MKIGVMGGTFDPIHIGHLISAEYARENMKLDKVLFMPSGRHPFKEDNKVSSPDIRVEMTSLAVAENPYFEVCEIGVNKQSIDYTIDDVREIREEYPDDEIYFIIGSDIIDQIEKWKDFYKLTKLCKFVLFDRWGKEEDRINEKIKELELLYKFDIQKIKSPIIEISSTAIRNRRREELSIEHMLPKTVEDYIIKYGIYLEEI